MEMKDINHGLNYLLEKYHVAGSGKISGEGLALTANGREIPLLPWRNERRFIELKNLVNDGTLQGISVMRSCRIDKTGTPIKKLLYRELDLCQWILGSRAAEIFTVTNGGKTANIIVKLDSGIVCTIEAAAALPQEAEAIDKHEIISQKGVACDRVVDTQIPQHSIYLYTQEKHPTTYMDVDFELYGYRIEDVALIRQSFEIMKTKNLEDEFIQQARYLDYLVDLSQKSAELACNLQVEEINV